MNSNGKSHGRQVRDVVTGTRQHFARAVRAGDFLFLSGNGFDGDGIPLPSAVPGEPYHLSEAAHCVMQTKAIYDEYRSAMQEFGCSFSDTVQIEQFIPHKIYGDAYVNTSRGPGYLERNRPTSALLVTGDLGLEGQVVAQSAIVAIPSASVAKHIVRADVEFTADTVKAEYGESWAEEPPFHEVVTAGSHLFTVGQMAFDWVRGEIPVGVKVAPFTYWGSEIRSETEFLLQQLREYTERVGGSLQDITHVTVYLTNIGDVFEMDRVWIKYFGESPPSRTVVPVRAQGSPRHEAPGQSHADNAPRLEHIAQGILTTRGASRESVETPYSSLGHAAVATKGGNFMWVSEQYGRAEDSQPNVSGDTREQLRVIFERLRRISTAAGADFRNAVRIRAFLADGSESSLLADELREAFPVDPPTVITTGVSGELLVPGARVAVDAIIYLPGD